MTAPKFTKGPWSACCGDRPEINCGLVFGDGGEVFVALAFGPANISECDPVPSQEEEFANKHLIAAAPDLYEALCIAVDALEFSGADKRMPHNIAKLHAALAKARGEEPTP